MKDTKKIIAIFILILLMKASLCFASGFNLDRSIGMLSGISNAGGLIKELDLPLPGEGRSLSQKPLNTQLSGGKEGRDNRNNQSGNNSQESSSRNRGEDNRDRKKIGSQQNPNDMGNNGRDGNRNPGDDKNGKTFSEEIVEEIPEELYKSVYITKEDLLSICSSAKVTIKTLIEQYQNDREKHKVLVNLIALEAYKSNKSLTFKKLGELYDDKAVLTDLAASANSSKKWPKSLVIWARFAVNFNALFDFEPHDVMLNNGQKSSFEYSKIPAEIGLEKNSYDYVYVDPENFIHILCPLVGGETIGLDNTCQTLEEITRFFYGKKNNSIINILNGYKHDLKGDIKTIRSTCSKNNALVSKRDRLEQIKKYLSLLGSYEESSIRGRYYRYPPEVENLLRDKTNCVSICLSPLQIDSVLRASSGNIFSVKRRRNNVGELQASETPLMYSLITLFRNKELASKLANLDVNKKILDNVEKKFGINEMDITDKSVSEITSFLYDSIKETVNTQVTENINLDLANTGDKITASYLSDTMMSKKDTPRDTGRNILLSALNENFWGDLINQFIFAAKGDNYSIDDNSSVPNKLSIAVQFFLAEINLFCYFNNKSQENFGVKLDKDELLIAKLVSAIEDAINNESSIENRLIDFVNDNEESFGLKDKISKDEASKIIERFNMEYQIVRDSPHMDEFLLFDKKPGSFVVHKGRISFNALNLIDPDKDEFIPEHLMQFNELNIPILPHKNDFFIKVIKYGDLVNYLESLGKDNFALILNKMINLDYNIGLISTLLVAHFASESMSIPKIDALTSDGAIAAYRGGATFEALNELYDRDYSKFQALASCSIKEAYYSGAKFDLFNNLYDENKTKFQELTSSSSIEIYKARVKFDDLNNLYDKGKFKFQELTSYSVIQAYKAGAKFAILNEMYYKNYRKFQKLTSYSMRVVYKSGAKFDYLSKMYDEDNRKFKSLTSDEAINAYSEGYATFDDLKDFDAEKIKVLTSRYSREAYYEQKYVTLGDLKDFDIEKIIALTSDSARRGYDKEYFAFNDLKNFDAESIKLLVSLDNKNKINAITSYGAIEAYKAGARLGDLSNLYDDDNDKFKALTSDDVVRLYSRGCVTFNALKDFDAEKIIALTSLDDDNKILALTSYRAIAAYKAGATFDLLSRLYTNNNDKFKALTSDGAIRLYSRRRVTFGDLKYFGAEEIMALTSLNDDNKIVALTSYHAIEAYKAGARLEDLSNLYDDDNDKFKALTSDDVIRLYRIAGVIFDVLKDFDIEKIMALTSDSAIESYGKYATFDKLKDFNAEKIKALTSWNAIIIYRKKYVTFDDLKYFDVEKIKVLTLLDNQDKINALMSYSTMEACNSGYLTFANLKDFDTEKIMALTSYIAIGAYQSGYINFGNLKDFDTGKIIELTTYYAGIAYGSLYINVASSRDLYAKKIKLLMSWDNQDKINAIMSYGAIWVCNSGYVDFDTLKDFNSEKIRALTSDGAIAAYQAGAKFEVFSKLYDNKSDKFKALTFDGAIAAYKAGARFDFLNKLYVWDNDKFKALTSAGAIKAYQSGCFTFDNIKDFDSEKIRALTSYKVIAVFKVGFLNFNNLKDLSIGEVVKMADDYYKIADRQGLITWKT